MKSIVLIGVIASSVSSQSIAVFKDKEQTSFFREGDSVNGWKLFKISSKKVTLQKNESQIHLRPRGVGYLEITPESKFKTSMTKNPIHLEIKSNGDVRIDKSFKDHLINNKINEILFQASTTPIFKEAEVFGYELNDIESGSIFELVGIQNGDIIKAINGRKLGNAIRAIQWLKTIQNDDEYRIEILRNRKNKVLKIGVTEF